MPSRLSPGTFLSLLHRHPKTGAPLDPEVYLDRLARERRDDPQDVVVPAPSVDPEMTQLIGYDIHGVVRVKIEVAERDAGWWEGLMLRYMRWRFGRPIRLIR